MELPKEFVEKVDESIGELQTVIGDLDKLAKIDGTVTDDESSLIKNIKKNLYDYCEFLEEVIEDGKITEEEYRKMKEYEVWILDDAEAKAKSDNVTSDDEKKILDMLTSLINEIGTLEYQ